MRKKVAQKIKERVIKSYGAIAPDFDRTRKVPWQEFEHFLAYVRKGDKVLDVGCGNGRLYEVLARKEVHYLGVDNNSHLLDLAQRNYPEAHFELADMTDMNLEEGAFDVAFSVAAFHHLPGKAERRKAVQEFHHVLKEGGVLVLTVWNLFQWRYFKNALRALLSFLFHLGFKAAWNDIWVGWGSKKEKRYYHSFLPSELRHYFSKNQWEIEEFYFTRKGNRVPYYRCFNIVLIARKK